MKKTGDVFAGSTQVISTGIFGTFSALFRIEAADLSPSPLRLFPATDAADPFTVVEFATAGGGNVWSGTGGSVTLWSSTLVPHPKQYNAPSRISAPHLSQIVSFTANSAITVDLWGMQCRCKLLYRLFDIGLRPRHILSAASFPGQSIEHFRKNFFHQRSRRRKA